MAIKEVGTFEAKTRLSELLDEVEKGEKIYITRHGKRVAELSPATPTRRGKRGCAKARGKGKTFYMAPDFDAPLDDFKDYQ